MALTGSIAMILDERAARCGGMTTAYVAGPYRGDPTIFKSLLSLASVLFVYSSSIFVVMKSSCGKIEPCEESSLSVQGSIF